MVYMPMSRYPGKSLGPAYVLVMRLNPGMPTLYGRLVPTSNREHALAWRTTA